MNGLHIAQAALEIAGMYSKSGLTHLFLVLLSYQGLLQPYNLRKYILENGDQSLEQWDGDIGSSVILWEYTGCH